MDGNSVLFHIEWFRPEVFAIVNLALKPIEDPQSVNGQPHSSIKNGGVACSFKDSVYIAYSLDGLL